MAKAVIGISLVLGLALAGCQMERPQPPATTSYEPLSKTAIAITGPIAVSDTAIRFGTGKTVGLRLVDAQAWGNWGFAGGGKSLARVYALDGDPGILLNGNRLCRPGAPARYIAVTRGQATGTPAPLYLATFNGPEPPRELAAPGLCGTYSYLPARKAAG